MDTKKLMDDMAKLAKEIAEKSADMPNFDPRVTQIEIEGEYLDVRVDGGYTKSVEPNYGADADGNRGESRTFIEVNGIIITNEEDGADITKLIEESYPQTYTQLLNMFHDYVCDEEGML